MCVQKRNRDLFEAEESAEGAPPGKKAKSGNSKLNTIEEEPEDAEIETEEDGKVKKLSPARRQTRVIAFFPGLERFEGR